MSLVRFVGFQRGLSPKISSSFLPSPNTFTSPNSFFFHYLLQTAVNVYITKTLERKHQTLLLFSCPTFISPAYLKLVVTSLFLLQIISEEASVTNWLLQWREQPITLGVQGIVWGIGSEMCSLAFYFTNSLLDIHTYSDTEANFWGSILLPKIIFQSSNRTATRFKCSKSTEKLICFAFERWHSFVGDTFRNLWACEFPAVSHTSDVIWFTHCSRLILDLVCFAEKNKRIRKYRVLKFLTCSQQVFPKP